jgi:hypothetical protein
MGVWQGVANWPWTPLSLGPAMPNPSTLYGRATPETALPGGRPAADFYSFGHPTPYASGSGDEVNLPCGMRTRILGVARSPNIEVLFNFVCRQIFRGDIRSRQITGSEGTMYLVHEGKLISGIN